MILSWSERMISHTGTETRPRRFRAAAVRNFGQWAKAWSSYIAWMKKAQLVVKFILSFKIMTLMKRTVPANSVPAAAVIRGGRALFEMIGRKGHVDGFLSGQYILWERIVGYGRNFLLYSDPSITIQPKNFLYLGKRPRLNHGGSH